MQTGPFRAIAVMNERTRRWFDPEIVQATLDLHRAGRLWLFCLPGDGHERAHQAVLGMVPARAEKLQVASIDRICEAFAEVVDAKSPLTFSHSIGVKDAAMAIGETMGLPKARLDVLRRAALLHDLGKLSVPNTILDKPGRLDAAEFGIVKRHSALTRQILSRMPSFAEIAILAGEHHEKLDGSGYPDGLEAKDLSLESRIIAVADVYGALSEHRPYRPALEPDEITRILREQVPGKLDGRCFEALQAARQARPTPAVPPIPLPPLVKKPPALVEAAAPHVHVGARA
jgi:putative nucleotidyltransferase with HDIG domain